MIKYLSLLSAFFIFNNLFGQTVCTRMVTSFDYSTTTGYSIQGTAELKDSLGVLYLSLSSDFSTSSGPDLYIYLTETGEAPTALGNDDYEVAILSSNTGAQSYTISSGVDLDDYDYVTIHCKQFNHLWNSGMLNSQSCFSYPSYSEIEIEECFDYTSPSGNNTWTTSGVYSDTLIGMNSNGGDSIISIDLVINSVSNLVNQVSNSIELMSVASNSTFQWKNCDNDFLISGETNASFTPTESGNYAVVITSADGCEIISSCFSVLILEECLNYTSPSGLNEWNISGVYSDTLVGMNSEGEDSIIKIDLTINDVDVSVNQSSQSEELTANADNSTFQWINCTNNAIIPGETDETYTPLMVGEYAVIVTNSENCSDTSTCFSTQSIGIFENGISTYSIFPNPTTGVINIKGKEIDKESISIFNVLNQRMEFSVNEINEENIKLTLNGVIGVYYIQFRELNGDIQILKMIKN